LECPDSEFFWFFGRHLNKERMATRGELMQREERMRTVGEAMVGSLTIDSLLLWKPFVEA